VLPKTKMTGEIFTHNTLWTMANRHINYALANERGSFYDYLSAMVFSFLTFEAYLNFVGENCAPSFGQTSGESFAAGFYRRRNLFSRSASSGAVGSG